MKHFSTLIFVLSLTSGGKCIVSEDFIIDFTSNPEDELFFFLKNNTSDFESAKSICHSFNGRLPLSLDELNKYTLGNENFKLNGHYFWTGMSKEANSVYKWQDGRYIEYHKLGLIETWRHDLSSCSQRCCGLTADPGHFNQLIYGERVPVNLKETPCELKRSVACLVKSPHSMLINHIRPTLRLLQSTTRYDLPVAESLQVDYSSLKKSIRKLRVPIETLISEIDEIEKKSSSFNSNETSKYILYHHKETKSSFNETINLCEKKGGHMLQVTSDEQVKQVATLLGESNEYWIGYIRQKDGKYRSLVDSSEIKFTPWMTDKPDCSSSEPCCALAISTWNLNNGKGELFDAACDHLFNSVCSIPVKVEASDEQKIQQLTFLTKLAVEQEKILLQLVSMFTQLSYSFHSQ